RTSTTMTALRSISYLIGISLTCNLSAQVEPHAGQWKTWVIPSGSALRLAPPPGSDVTTTELQWVKDSAAQRDAAALAQVRYWDAGSPAYRWMQIALQAVQNAAQPTPLQTR